MPNNYLDAMQAQARKDLTKITIETDRAILQAYKNAGDSLVKKFNASKEGSATRAYYASYIRSLNNEITSVTLKAGLESAEIPVSMKKLMTEQVFIEAGIDPDIVKNFDKTFGRIPYQSLARIIDGNIYKDKATMSERIWGYSLQAGKDIQGVVLQGLAQGTSAVKLSKALEAYVDPAVRKTWDKAKITEIFGKGYAGWNKQLEYNSLRLARTTITHSFQLSHLESNKKNPFVDGIRWHSVLQHGRTCEVCRERNNKIFKFDELPLDHPNGLCYQTSEITKSMDEIGDELKSWLKGGSNAKLDQWEQNMSPIKVFANGANTKVLKPNYRGVNKSAVPKELIRKKRVDFDNEDDYLAYRAKRDTIRAETQQYEKEQLEIMRNAPRKYTDTAQAEETIRKLGVEYVDLTGIDPLLYDDIISSMEYNIAKTPELLRTVRYVGTDAKTEGFIKKVIYPENVEREMVERGISREQAEKMVTDYMKTTYKNEGSIAEAWNGIVFSEKVYADFERVAMDDITSVLTGYRVQGNGTTTSIITHELGHNVDSLFSSLATAEERIKVKEDFVKLYNRKDELAEITEYGLTNQAECFAELYTDYIENPNPKPIVKEFGEWLNKALKALY